MSTKFNFARAFLISQVSKFCFLLFFIYYLHFRAIIHAVMIMGEIVIHDPELIGGRLTSSFTAPRALRKYFKSFDLFAAYDSDVAVDTSILNIPLTSVVLPLAWISGSDIRVDVLDRTFKESMDELKQEFKKVHQKAPFTTEIRADKLVDNRIKVDNHERRTGLLFSGGVDSTYSLITNLHLNPRLIMLWGADNFQYPEHSTHWELALSTYSEFAKRLGLVIHLVKTNVSQILNDRRIEHDFHETLFHGKFRNQFSHSLLLLPLAAPLSIGRFDRLLFAASQPIRLFGSMRLPYVSRPSTDEKIVWADLRVKHDGVILRNEKINGAIKDFLGNEKLVLRVCTKSSDQAARERMKLNDSACEKCFRTITSLIAAGIDPNSCGFEVDKTTFKRMKSFLEKRARTKGLDIHWPDILKSIPEGIDYNLEGSKEFFEWLRGFNPGQPGINLLECKTRYDKLPYAASKILNKYYRMRGINIFEYNPREN